MNSFTSSDTNQGETEEQVSRSTVIKFTVKINVLNIFL